VARCVIPSASVGTLHAAFRPGAFDGTRIFERLPAELWPTLAPTAVADQLSSGIKRAYDPNNLLNPGILGEPDA
jgi:FAD/FMN-containing dehydrogenase